MSKKHKHKPAATVAKTTSHVPYHYGKEPKVAFQLGSRNVWGGGATFMLQRPWAMLICCSDRVPSSPLFVSTRAKMLMPKLHTQEGQPYVRIAWPDWGSPRLLAREFWESLVLSLKQLGAPGPIGVCCQGGTGRTGTALAILASLSDNVPIEQCPVSFVRQHYYGDAVESSEQGEYIEACTGRNVSTPIYGPKDWDSMTSIENYETKKCVHGISLWKHCDYCDLGRNTATGVPGKIVTVPLVPDTSKQLSFDASGTSHRVPIDMQSANYLSERSAGHAI